MDSHELVANRYKLVLFSIMCMSSF